MNSLIPMPGCERMWSGFRLLLEQLGEAPVTRVVARAARTGERRVGRG